MTLLPIVTRELRVAARRPHTYRMRMLVALGVVAAAALVFVFLRGMPPQAVGKTLFGVMSGCVLFYCAIAGPLLTADCLSEEKREGTLGLLFLTDLNGYDVVLGKLATTSINAFYSLLAVLPVLALPLLLGGVAGGELSRMGLVFTNTLFLSLTAGLLASAISFHARKAANAAVGLVLLLCIGAPVLGEWLEHVFQARGGLEALAMVSPVYAFSFAFEARYRLGTERFWTSMAVIHLLAWLFLMLSSRVVKRSWQDRPKRVGTRGWQAAWRAWSQGNPTTRRAVRMRMLRINPFLWRAGRELWKPRAVWLSMGLVGLAWLWGVVRYGSDWIGPVPYITTGLVLLVGLKLGIAVEAGYAFGEDRRSGALELVLVTPLSVEDLIRGQLLALKRQFFAPACVTVALCLLFLLLTLADRNWDRTDGERAIVIWLAVMLVFVADCAALALVGMWMGLARGHPNRASSDTIGRVLVSPWVVFMLGLIWLAVQRFANVEWWFFLALWFVPSLVVDIAFGVWAWQKLHREFRRMATERFTSRQAWWQRLFGG